MESGLYPAHPFSLLSVLMYTLGGPESRGACSAAAVGRTGTVIGAAISAVRLAAGLIVVVVVLVT